MYATNSGAKAWIIEPILSVVKKIVGDLRQRIIS